MKAPFSEIFFRTVFLLLLLFLPHELKGQTEIIEGTNTKLEYELKFYTDSVTVFSTEDHFKSISIALSPYRKAKTLYFSYGFSFSDKTDTQSDLGFVMFRNDFIKTGEYPIVEIPSVSFFNDNIALPVEYEEDVFYLSLRYEQKEYSNDLFKSGMFRIVKVERDLIEVHFEIDLNEPSELKKVEGYFIHRI